MRRATFILLTATALSLSACAAPLVLGAGAAAGYVGLQDRPARQTASDSKVKLAIQNHLSQAQFGYLTDVGIDVFYGDVLLTGVLPTTAMAEQVLDLTRRTEGVRTVYNELFVGAAYTAKQKATDAWISAQLQTTLISTPNAYPINYLTSVANSHIYIMGSVANAAERRAVLERLSRIRGVKQVHDYLVIAGERAPNKPYVPVNMIDKADRRAPNPLSGTIDN